MVGGLKDKIKGFADKAVFVGKLTLVALVAIYCVKVCASLGKVYFASRDLHINYAVDSSKNDQIGELLDIRLVWKNIAPNYDDYSTLEILKKTSVLVHYFVEHEENDSSTKIEHILGDNLLFCQKYMFLTYAGFVDLTEKHPELSHHLENVRIVAGNISNGRVEGLHVWLEVKEGDEWEDYETTDLHDGVEYYPWISFRKLKDDSIESYVNYYNIVIHEGDVTKSIFMDLENRIDRTILDRPYTNLVDDLVVTTILTLTGYAAFELRKRPKTKPLKKD